MKYSNPRMTATIENWPSGKKRVTAVFSIEQTNRGERAVRQTTGAPKKLTYASKARIVDGDDGRTYIAEWSAPYRMIIIINGDMKFTKETVISRDDRYKEMMKELFGEV